MGRERQKWRAARRRSWSTRTTGRERGSNKEEGAGSRGERGKGPSRTGGTDTQRGAGFRTLGNWREGERERKLQKGNTAERNL